jgi:hypothetical protein
LLSLPSIFSGVFNVLMNFSTLKSGQLDSFLHGSYNEPQAFRYSTSDEKVIYGNFVHAAF